MKRLIIVIAGCTALLGSAACGQGLSERINHLMQQRAREQANNPTKARMLGKLLYTDMSVRFEATAARDAINYVKTALGINIIGRYNDDRTGFGIDPETEISLDVEDKPALTVLELILDQCRAESVEECPWQLRDGFVEVGTKDRLGKARELRYYPIRDLLFEPTYFDNAPDLDLSSALSQGGGGGYGGGGGGGGGSGGGGGYGGGGGGGGSGGGGGYGGGGGALFGDPGSEPERVSEQEKADQIIALIQELVEPEGGWVEMGGEWATVRYYQGTLIIRAPDFMHRQIGGYPFAIRPSGTSVQQYAQTRYVTFTGGLSNVSLTSLQRSAPISGAPGSSGTPGTPGTPGESGAGNDRVPPENARQPNQKNNNSPGEKKAP